MGSAPLRSSAILAKVGVAVVSMLVALGAVELYFRLTYEPMASYQGDFLPGRFPKLNADGLRDVDHGPKEAGVYRILLLGDSFTFGSGVEEDDLIWPAIVERRLAEIRPIAGISTYEVLNAGIAGSLTDKWVAVYRYLREGFRPDLVLAVFFLRDGTNFEEGILALMRPEIARMEQDRFGKLSATYRYFVERRWKLALSRAIEKLFLDSYVGESTAEWRRAQDNLRTIRDIARADGARFGVAVFPLLLELERDPYPFQPVMDAIQDFCAANDIPSMSLLPAFRGRRSSDLWVSEGNQHPNVQGHAIAADALLDFTRRLMTQAPAG